MNTGRIDGSPNCPHCSEILSGYDETTDEGGPPDPGDVSVCCHCFEWLEYAEDLSLIPIQSETLDEDGVLLELQTATKALRALHDEFQANKRRGGGRQLIFGRLC